MFNCNLFSLHLDAYVNVVQINFSWLNVEVIIYGLWIGGEALIFSLTWWFCLHQGYALGKKRCKGLFYSFNRWKTLSWIWARSPYFFDGRCWFWYASSLVVSLCFLNYTREPHRNYIMSGFTSRNFFLSCVMSLEPFSLVEFLWEHNNFPFPA